MTFIYTPPRELLVYLYQDDVMLVLDKPAGLLSVRGRKAEHQDSLETRVQERYPEARIVHRLDMDTSGVMVLARSAEAHKALSRQFEERKTLKIYQALMHGHMREEGGEVNLPLRCDWENRPRQMVCYEHGRPSVTRFEVLERMDNGCTRAALYPVTGRSHQLRVHMAEIGYSIVGDRFYGNDDASRLCLHAHVLGVAHPASGAVMRFESAVPF